MQRQESPDDSTSPPVQAFPVRREVAAGTPVIEPLRRGWGQGNTEEALIVTSRGVQRLQIHGNGSERCIL